MGGREVSRESFRHALRGGRSCLVVPGGQAEMLQSQSDDVEVTWKPLNCFAMLSTISCLLFN